MEKLEKILIKTIPHGTKCLIPAKNYNPELHELVVEKVKKTPVIEPKEDEKIEVEEIIVDLPKEEKKEENKCEICGQVCKSAAGLKMHMKKHDK